MTPFFILQSEVKELEAKANTAVAKLFGYENEQARELMETVSAEYSPEEFVELLSEVAAMGRDTESLLRDERLVSTLRTLTYLETLQGSGADELNEKMKDDVYGFYEEHEHLLSEEPTSEEERHFESWRRSRSDLTWLTRPTQSNQSE